jgi:hypothetical protein
VFNVLSAVENYAAFKKFDWKYKSTPSGFLPKKKFVGNLNITVMQPNK